MTKLSKRLGNIPYKYTVNGSGPNADFQVTVTGPAGRAVITEVDWPTDDYEIETSFRGESTRIYTGNDSPRAALDKVVALNNTRLTILGETPPPAVSPAARVLTVAKVAAVLVLAVVGIALVWPGSSGTGDDIPPAPSITQGPVVQVTIRGDGTYTDAECDARRVVALSNSTEAGDAAVEYDLHCTTRTILDSPAPMETTR